MSPDPTTPPPDAARIARRVAWQVAGLAALLFTLGMLCLVGAGATALRAAAALAMLAGVGAAALAIVQLRSLRAPQGSPIESMVDAADATAGAWDGRDRRGPNRARNVARLPKRGANHAGDDDQWEAF